jgi:hypothetical protein
LEVDCGVGPQLVEGGIELTHGGAKWCRDIGELAAAELEQPML